MFSKHFVQGILLIFILNETKSENNKNNLDDKPSEVSSTKKDLNFSYLETFAPLNNNSNSDDIDFMSLSLENIAATTTQPQPNLNDLSSTASANDWKDKETTASWELIYPEQNSSIAVTSSTAAPPATSSFNPASTETFKKVALPTYFKVDDVTNCRKFFGQCLKQVLANIVPKLKDGHTTPSLDPLYFNATAFQYNSGPFTGYITIRYALVYGLTTIKFKKIDFHQQNDRFKARLKMLVPKMSVIGAYKGDLHVNNVRVRPRGDFNVSVTALGVEMLSLGVIYEKDNHTFVKFIKSNATTTLKDSKINATGIFPDQRLNDIVVNVANQYWRDLFNVVLPETRNSWLPILLDTLNAALDMVPFDFFKTTS